MPDVTPNAAVPDNTTPAPAAAPAAPAPAAAPPKSTTTLSAEPAQEPAKAYWPDDWRKKWAGEDEKKLSRLEKYLSPENAFDALIAAQNKISSGQHKQPPGENATPEELADWRKANNIPESPEKYDLNMGNGLVIGEEDKPIIDEFLKAAHQANLGNDAVRKVVNWYYDEQARMEQKRHQKDQADLERAQDALNAEWGQNFRRYKNDIENFLSGTFNADEVEQLRHARLADGTALWNNVNIVKAFAQLAHSANPAATVVPAGDANPMGTISDEIAKIEKFMRTNRTEYNRDSAIQDRLQKLYEAREKLKSKAA